MPDARLSALTYLREAILDGFENSGAQRCDVPSLLPADVLLDLYGEDIRARAYTTLDPVRGELILRPDFTVPIVQEHMRTGADPARYCYAGSVWRKQGDGSDIDSEYLQVGYELFDGSDKAAADAELFVLIDRALEDFDVTPSMGDVSILRAAVQGLQTTDRRKAALMRHLWRQDRFENLLMRFGDQASQPIGREKFLGSVLDDVDLMISKAGTHVGLRSREEIRARVETLVADDAEPPISGREVALIRQILALEAPSGDALGRLRDLQDQMPSLEPSLDGLEARLDALAKRGVDVDMFDFQGGYGLDSMEYYDGFVFGFTKGRRLVASGGRYDALTQVLGNGRSIPAVGGIIRPQLLLGDT